jgi:FkbH-like protein
MASRFGPYHGRDPAALLERFRREAREGGEFYYAASAARKVDDFSASGQQVDLMLFGDCDVHIESDFLRREARARGVDLKVAATAPDDVRFASDHKHDAILIGALRARRSIMDNDGAQPPHAAFIAEARQMIEALRTRSAAPILIDNLPEPTVQPMGFADRGRQGHRNRFRIANLALEELAAEYPDVYVVDVAATLGAVGSERMLDDGHLGFTHFGSPGWLLQRPESEKAAVHGIFPDLAPLAQWVGGDPYGREAVLARAHIDVLSFVLGLDRKKCVIVDLDGVLWPGVLAETGSPFAWSPEVNSFSYVGLFFGLHEALRSLKKRGILLACVSKNDESLVRDLWNGKGQYRPNLLLTLDDFVTWRINWNDKVENIRSIGEQLGLALESFIFIDDSPIERDRVRQRLPEVEVWGEELFSLRRRLLNDPRLQMPSSGGDAPDRTELTKALLQRQSARAESLSEDDFLASLDIQVRIERLTHGDKLERVAELFQRTTQFNTTGAKFSVAGLDALLRTPGAHIYIVHVADRFGDHGLVGAAVIKDGVIAGFALSCRVLGLGVEHKFLQHILDELSRDHDRLVAQIIPTARNNPVRNLYRDNGFVLNDDGFWCRQLAGS